LNSGKKVKVDAAAACLYVIHHTLSVNIREAATTLSFSHSLIHSVSYPLEKEGKKGRKRKIQTNEFNLSIY
jgi:hypothetical protein